MRWFAQTVPPGVRDIVSTVGKGTRNVSRICATTLCKGEESADETENTMAVNRTGNQFVFFDEINAYFIPVVVT